MARPGQVVTVVLGAATRGIPITDFSHTAPLITESRARAQEFLGQASAVLAVQAAGHRGQLRDVSMSPSDARQRRLRGVASGDRTPVELEAYDPRWPDVFERVAAETRDAIGTLALEMHHIGSTAVPGLVAKPVIDIALVVADSSDEASYLPALERGGYRLVVREPEWYEHRMFQRADPAVNLHVYSTGCDELRRILAFRDRLRANQADRELYQATKLRLSERSWEHVQDYADAKTAVIAKILSRTANTAL
jgi:GrpB-like predicted nucleotidyltransferase (UPF0157 family)